MAKSNYSIPDELPTPQLNISIDGNVITGGGSSSSGTNTNSGDTVPTGDNISQMPDTTPSSATEISDKARGNYPDEAVESDIDIHKARQSAIDSSYTDNPEEWSRRYAYWDTNLAKDNPRGNLNGMTFRDTRLHSRLADALNNERHLKPTDIGRRTLNYGATGTGADQAGSERWEPIETQEMRQMRANERLDEKARGYDVDRQKMIEDYPMELRKQMDKVNSDIAKYATTTGIDLERLMQRGIFDAEYGQSWSTFWNTLQTRFAMELGQDLKERIFAKLGKLPYIARQMYSYVNQTGSVPSPLTKAFYDLLQQKMNSAPTDEERFGYGMWGLLMTGALGLSDITSILGLGNLSL